MYHHGTCPADAATNKILELHEFMLAGEELIGGGGEEQPTPAAAVQYKSAVFAFKTMTTKSLVEIAKKMGIQYTRAKKMVWDWIIQFGHMRISSVADNGLSFTFKCVKPKEGSVPLWFILVPEDVQVYHRDLNSMIAMGYL